MTPLTIAPGLRRPTVRVRPEAARERLRALGLSAVSGWRTNRCLGVVVRHVARYYAIEGAAATGNHRGAGTS